MYEVKGLVIRKYTSPTTQQPSHEAKHRKTLDDVHKSQVTQVKFIGDFTKEIMAISCDVNGTICLTTFSDTYFMYRASTTAIKVPVTAPVVCLSYCN